MFILKLNNGKLETYLPENYEPKKYNDDKTPILVPKLSNINIHKFEDWLDMYEDFFDDYIYSIWCTLMTNGINVSYTIFSNQMKKKLYKKSISRYKSYDLLF